MYNEGNKFRKVTLLGNSAHEHDVGNAIYKENFECFCLQEGGRERGREGGRERGEGREGERGGGKEGERGEGREGESERESNLN